MNALLGQVYVGPAGWSYEDWKGTVYPEPPPPKFDPLVFVARFFDLVEINSSFYRPPTRGMAESWARRVRDRDRFKFTVKVHRAFTHGADDEASRESAREFTSALKPLFGENRLGALLFQFPFWFRDEPKNRERLRRLAEWFDGPTPRHVEIRNTSWLRREPMTFLHHLGFGFVNIDLPPSRTNPPPTGFATTTVGYVRLHGRNSEAWFAKSAGRNQKYDYTYGAAELDEWVKRVATLRGKTTVTYVVANNHFRGQAPANALQIMAKIAGSKVPVPRALARTYPDLYSEGDPVD